MNVFTALGLALGASVMAAAAEPPDAHLMHHHPGMELNIDANHDGWVSRDEAAAAADRMFDDLDSNHDGRLTGADHPAMDADFDVHVGGPGEMDMPEDPNCTRTVSPSHEGDGQRITIICDEDGDHGGGGPSAHRMVMRHEDDGDAHHATDERQRVERDVVIMRHGGEAMAGAPPMPPMPPHPPMFMMLMASSDEADTNGDGALSREEFRAQQLRFFDASDANRDGKIRFDPPEPPMPPTPPTPPTPPSPPRH